MCRSFLIFFHWQIILISQCLCCCFLQSWLLAQKRHCQSPFAFSLLTWFAVAFIKYDCFFKLYQMFCIIHLILFLANSKVLFHFCCATLLQCKWPVIKSHSCASEAKLIASVSLTVFSSLLFACGQLENHYWAIRLLLMNSQLFRCHLCSRDAAALCIAHSRTQTQSQHEFVPICPYRYDISRHRGRGR